MEDKKNQKAIPKSRLSRFGGVARINRWRERVIRDSKFSTASMPLAIEECKFQANDRN